MHILNGFNSSGVPINHFYQTSSLTRDGVAYSSHQQQLSQNFNSLDYSDSGTQQRMFNDSGNLLQQNQAQVIGSQQSNIKRNNFLSNPQNNQDDHASTLSPESKSQPNPPTLRKITLNQRILQKNMMRISQNNIQQPNQQLLNAQMQQINQNNSLEDVKQGSKLNITSITLRNKKFSQPKVLQNVNQLFANQQFQLQQQKTQFDPSQNNTIDSSPLNPQAQLTQTIQKIYGNQRKDGVINYSQQQPDQKQQQLQNQTIDQTSISQLKRKHIKIKKSFIQSHDLANQLNLTIKTNNANKSSIPQLNLSNISQENSNQDNQTQAQPQVTLQYINQGTVASARRHQIKVDSQRKQINLTQQDHSSTFSNHPNNQTQLSNLHLKNQVFAQSLKQESSFSQQQPQNIQLSNRSNKSNNINGLEQDTTHSHNQQQQATPIYSHRETAISKTLQSARQEVDSQQQQQQNQKSQRGLPTQIQNQSSNESIRLEDVKFPITPGRTLKYFKHQLTQYEQTEILDYPQIYYIGQGAAKVKGSATNEFNFGYDDKKGNYKIVLKDHIGYRFEVIQFLGKGSFGIALKCFDHKLKTEVAVKVIKNKKKYYYQAGVELKILQYLKENDPDDTMNIIHMYDYVIFRKHLCISFELMSINLYDFLKLNDFEGLSLGLVRRFAIQLLYALKYLKEHQVIHCDLKPENILLKDPTKSGIKIIDFGSSCFQDERIYTYIQSRFYRAPEIILGIPYTTSIDMWSFGCIMAEFCIGYPLFPGEDEMEQLSMIMEVCGIPSQEVLNVSQRKKKFFDDNNAPILVHNSKGQVRRPGTKIIEDILDCRDFSFVSFVEKCLDWNPETRLTPDQALRHPWILEGLPPKVLIHHQKLHNIPTSELPPNIREIRRQYLLKEQGINETQINDPSSSVPQQPQQQKPRSEVRKLQNQIIKRKPSIEQSIQPTQIVSQSQENQGLMNNIISPRTKKIALQSHDNAHIARQQQQQHLQGQNQLNQGMIHQMQAQQQQPQISASITSNFVPLKAQNSNNSTIDSSKILENTLRNRKIILQSGLKWSAENNPISIGSEQYNLKKAVNKSNANASMTIIQNINQQPANEQAQTINASNTRKQNL